MGLWRKIYSGWKEICKISTYISSYFTKKNKSEILTVSFIYAATNILEFAMTSYLVNKTQENNEDGAVDCPDTDYNLALGTMFLAVGTMGIRHATGHYLKKSAAQTYKKDLVSRYLSNRSQLGIGFIHKKNELEIESKIYDVVTIHIKKFSEGAVDITIDSLSQVFSMATHLYCANRIFPNKKIMVISASLALLIAVVYQILINIKENIDEEFSNISENINARLANVEKHKNEITAFNGEKYEILKIMDNFQKQEISFKKIFLIDFFDESFTIFAYFGFPVLLKFLAPYVFDSEEASDLSDLDIFSSQMVLAMNCVQEVIKSYTKGRSKMQLSFDKIKCLALKLDAWEEYISKRSFEQVFGANNFRIEWLNMARPPNSESLKDQIEFEKFFNATFTEQVNDALVKNSKLLLLDHANLELRKPLTYRLVGESSAGKSTAFKTIFGIWPYASGKISYNCASNEVFFLPQDPFLSSDCTLLEAIIYPKCLPNNKFEIKQLEKRVLYFLKILNLHKLKSFINIKRKDWFHLSRGEQQRIGIIRVLLSDPKPKILMMDESTASIDPNNSKLADALIRYYLPETIIIYIEHNDNDERQRTRTFSSLPMQEIELDAVQRTEENYFLTYFNSFRKSEIELEMIGNQFKLAKKTFKARLPNAVNDTIFEEFEVAGDGSCGFHSLGTSRKQTVELLLPLSKNEMIRKELAPEIMQALGGNDIGSAATKASDELCKRYNLHLELRPKLEAEANSLVRKFEPNSPYRGLINLIFHMKKQGNKEYVEMLNKLEIYLKNESECEQEIDKYTCSEEAYKAYVISLGKSAWLGYKSAKLIARLTKKNLYIWTLSVREPDTLELRDYNVEPKNIDVIHMLHTCGFTHFNILAETLLGSNQPINAHDDKKSVIALKP